MKYTYSINLETPAKKNANKVSFKTKRTYKSKNFQLWHEQAEAQLLRQTRPLEPINYPVTIKLKFIHGDLRRRDSDNGTSSILDLLSDVKILNDDKWQIVRHLIIENDYQKGFPKCEIEITNYISKD